MCLECNFHTRTPIFLCESHHGARPHLIGRQRPLLPTAEITDRGVARTPTSRESSQKKECRKIRKHTKLLPRNATRDTA